MNPSQTDSQTVPNQGPPWHALPPEAALEVIQGRPEGLSDSEARARLARHGPNVLQRVSGEGPLKLLWRQVNNPLIWVLLAAAGLAVALGKGTDGLIVFAVVVLNTLIGFVQEFRAGKAIEALTQMVPENATVLREGRKVTVPSAELVPGDVVLLASGDKVPADVRLLAERNLQVEEAALTGESVPSEKRVAPVAPGVGVGDRTSMAFGGTHVTSGTGTAVVVATGGATELGRISQLLREAVDLQTPLTKALASIGRYLTLAILVISAVLLGVGLLRSYGVAESLMAALTLAVAAIPEGLPAIVTIALAIGVQYMAVRRAIIRKLPAVETLGSTTVICSDKTGTLTRNEMTVQALWTPSGSYSVSGVGYAPHGEVRRDGQPLASPPEDVRELLVAGALCTDASVRHWDGAWELTGDPTEGALIAAAEKAGLPQDELRARHLRVDAIPFESENQFMATLHEDGRHGRVLFLKGAPEVVLRRCDMHDGVDAGTVHAEVERMASRGMRVLAVASQSVPASHDVLQVEDVAGGFRLLGLEGMIDPPREEAISAVKACHTAGITVKMITGDHAKTAEAIGEQLGILDEGRVVTGARLAEMDDARLREVAVSSNVFARVAPEHKLRLVRALQKEGQVVAMTGDGVNDAPALKQANIGVAMGITGTAVSKEAADIILTDDNFASIAAAVEEGRRVYDNLIKSLAFVLPTNLGLALILIVGVAFFPILHIDGEREPLLAMLPTQLLWINLVATVALALPLAFEAREPDVMKRPPRRPDAPVLSGFVVTRTLLVAVLMCVGATGLFLWEYNLEVARSGHSVAIREAQTMAVTTVIMFQIFYLLNCRSLRDSSLRIGLFSNPFVYLGIGALVLLQLGFIYLPFMRKVFHTAPLTLEALGLCALVGAIVLPVITVEKWWRSRRARRERGRRLPVRVPRRATVG
ncbi:HAD-IC family P-type ATPase [Vitiosangium sp. GDMCC 1.1324]|uniref:cation-translocating P-type ATPase n=1 Tax=Vitiosangium sp. (strain GDMCC 1.1324) TaxID=2138576 RepID=UPI000D38498A|nr:HAD-IC family P-type ATPase [Vitiosangium sp. GDMCC 1.1324]PTL85278.1 cation transporter [Vitiosangium sp. GDMCC 1.1324]